MADFAVVPARTALLNIDLQNLFVQRAADGLQTVERVNGLAALCREVGILVIHTSHVLRPDGSNVGVLREMVPGVRDLIGKGAESATLHAALAVEPGDVLLEKPRFGAFYGTDLELILRSRGIDTVIITGISTDVCCDTTAREANARDFRVLFLSDGTAPATSNSNEAARVQRATLEVLDGLFAQVLTIDELLQKISPGQSFIGPGTTS
jgi:nicotinamidase-related amidase